MEETAAFVGYHVFTFFFVEGVGKLTFVWRGEQWGASWLTCCETLEIFLYEKCLSTSSDTVGTHAQTGTLHQSFARQSPHAPQSAIMILSRELSIRGSVIE